MEMKPPHSSPDNEGKITTVIADDLEIKGIMKFKTSLMIKGVFEGEIISEGLLIVGPNAKVNATITTKNLISDGEIEGDVKASEQVILKKTSAHTGNITSPDLVIESGSIFNGTCFMQRATPVTDRTSGWEEEDTTESKEKGISMQKMTVVGRPS